MIRRLMRAVYREITENAVADTRCLSSWCDYGSHRMTGRKFIVEVKGTKLGQACWLHYGALVRDFHDAIIEFKETT